MLIFQEDPPCKVSPSDVQGMSAGLGYAMHIMKTWGMSEFALEVSCQRCAFVEKNVVDNENIVLSLALQVCALCHRHSTQHKF